MSKSKENFWKEENLFLWRFQNEILYVCVCVCVCVYTDGSV